MLKSAAKIIRRLQIELITRLIVIPFDIFYFFSLLVLLGKNTSSESLSKANPRSIPFILRMMGAKIGRGVSIERGLTLHNVHDYRNLVIGDNVSLGKNVFLDLRGAIYISDNTTISMNVTILTHIDLGYSKLEHLYPRIIRPVLIEESVYIGEGATLLMGVQLGKSCFIGAKSLVKDNCSEHSLYAGVPARFIKALNVK